MKPEETIEQRALKWASGETTGVSSMAILKVMTGDLPRSGYCYPHDGGDFGRCQGLLKLIPEWRERLSEMKKLGPEWSALVDKWDEIDALVSKGDHKLSYKKIQEILKPIEEKNRNIINMGNGARIYIPD